MNYCALDEPARRTSVSLQAQACKLELLEPPLLGTTAQSLSAENRAPQPIRSAEYTPAGATWGESQTEGNVGATKKKGTVAKRRPSPQLGHTKEART